MTDGDRIEKVAQAVYDEYRLITGDRVRWDKLSQQSKNYWCHVAYVAINTWQTSA